MMPKSLMSPPSIVVVQKQKIHHAPLLQKMAVATSPPTNINHSAGKQQSPNHLLVQSLTSFSCNMSSTKCHHPFRYHSFQSALLAWLLWWWWPGLKDHLQPPVTNSSLCSVDCLSFCPVHHLTNSAQDTLNDTKDYVHVLLNFSSWNPMTPFLPVKGITRFTWLGMVISSGLILRSKASLSWRPNLLEMSSLPRWRRFIWVLPILFGELGVIHIWYECTSWYSKHT